MLTLPEVGRGVRDGGLTRARAAQYGWGVAAIITPTVLLITGVAFFALVLGSGPLTPALASIGLTPLMAAVLVRPPRAALPKEPPRAWLCVSRAARLTVYKAVQLWLYEVARASFLSLRIIFKVLRGARHDAGG
jgi:hypothetical protein